MQKPPLPPLRQRPDDGDSQWGMMTIIVVGVGLLLLALIVLLLLLLLFLYRPVAGNPEGQVASAANATGDANEEPDKAAADKAAADKAAADKAAADQAALENNENKTPPGSQADRSETQPVEELPMLTLPSNNPNQLGVFSQKNKASLFGVQVVAERVAYVIDYSSSMSGEKLKRAQRELNDSVGRLTDRQIFTVLLFNTSAYSEPEFTEKPASQQAKNGLAKWLVQNYASGGTNPLPALEIVLKGDYDVVFLVSDGEFNVNTVKMIRKLNQKNIPISTISLSVDSQTLKMVAQENNGQYITVR